MDDAVRELVECFYAALDRRDWSTVEKLVPPRVVAEVGSSEPFGWDDWRANLEEIHIDRFQGDMLVAHRGQLDLHGLMEQLKGG
jgi:predicted ester cyclase